MMRLPLTLLTGVLAVSLTGCLDRGGLDDTNTGGSGGAERGSGGQGTSGGASGTGGLAAGGGSSGSGGVFATGGSVGAGGAVATGGNPGTGGKHGTGGSGGGVIGTGGTKGTGGVGGKGGGVMCGPVCDIYCANGHILDANGCETCACKPVACPTIACLVACPNGYIKDANGCSTCSCNTNPQACATSDCGTIPTAPYTVVCGATTNIANSGSGARADFAATAPLSMLICQRNSAGACVWQSNGCRVCPNLICASGCATGMKVAIDGCPTCVCST